MEKIPLVAVGISFTKFHIVYDVEVKSENGIVLPHYCPIYCEESISQKDLVMSPSIYSVYSNENKIAFCPTFTTTNFYQKILENSMNNIEEYVSKKNDIYLVGDVVGYLIL